MVLSHCGERESSNLSHKQVFVGATPTPATISIRPLERIMVFMKKSDIKITKIPRPTNLSRVYHCPSCKQTASKVEDLEECCDDDTPFAVRPFKNYGGE